MALLADSSADASSNLVQGVGTNSLTFTMPKNVAIKVESVVATVDNSAGAATVGKITVKDNSGQVIGTNEQGDAIPAGGSGTATFALGLDSGSGQGLHWGTNVDSLSQGLTLTGHGAFSTTTGNNNYSVNTGSGGISFACSAPGNFGVSVSNGDWSIASSGASVATSGNNTINIGAVNLSASVSGGMTLQATSGGSISMLASGGSIFLDATTAIQIRSAGGSQLLVVTP